MDREAMPFRRDAADRPLTPAPQPNTTIEADHAVGLRLLNGCILSSAWKESRAL
jgi:hypothetical protein